MTTVAWFAVVAAAWIGCGLGVVVAGLCIRNAQDDDPAAGLGPLVLEIEAGYPNGATGAILERATMEELERDGTHRVMIPPGSDHLAVRGVRRAGLYAGSTTMVEHESEPPPAFLTGGRS